MIPSRENDIKQLIFNYQRRLQKLKEQQALHGISVDPKVPIEIEDIESEIAKLQAELDQVRKSPQEVIISPPFYDTPQTPPQEIVTYSPPIFDLQHTREILYSTLLPVLEMPRYVYAAPCNYKDSEEKEAAKHIIYPKNDHMFPFIIRGGMLLCFQNLRFDSSPYRNLLSEQGKIEQYKVSEWRDNPDRMRWFVDLLNRSLNKLTGRKRLFYDKTHKRHYFKPKEPGKTLSISYRPLNKRFDKRQVVWQPITKKTGLPKKFWYHLGVSLKFHQFTGQFWALSIRPELHVTTDGENPLASHLIGSKVTRKKARRYNYDFLGDIQFWRDFLSDSKPRIILPFDQKQRIVISTTMMQAEIEWPGIPEEFAKPFKNVEYMDDLFSWAEYAGLEYEDDELEEEDYDAED